MSRYNDYKMIEKIKTKGFSGKYINLELRKLALFYRDKGMKPKQRREKLYEVCEDKIEGFNRVHYFSAINSAIRYSSDRKNKLIQVDYVEVTHSELDFLDELEIDHIYKKLLFTLIVADKLKKAVRKIVIEEEPADEYYMNSKTNRAFVELRKTSTVSDAIIKKNGHSDIHNVFFYFRELGLVQPNIGNVKLLFMYDIPEDEVNMIKVTDFENIGFYYDQYVGEKNIKECEDCERMMRVRASNQKYCTDCRKKVDKELRSKVNRRHYEKRVKRGQ